MSKESTWPHGWEGQLDRSAYTTRDTIKHIWEGLGLPENAVDHIKIHLPEEDEKALPSSFKIGHIAQASICLSAMSAALVDRHINKSLGTRSVTVPLKHAAVEFGSERHCLVDGKQLHAWGPLGGLYKTTDGYVRVHDNFVHHRKAACDILGLDVKATTKDEFSGRISQWKAIELERQAMEKGAVIFALRSYHEWEESEAGRHIMAGRSFPVHLTRIDTAGGATRALLQHMPRNADRCLRGLRVLELSRVIAAPVAGKTLAAHGADVLWVTSPNLPSLPNLDIDVSRGKRTIQLDLNAEEGVEKLENLIHDADVFIQSYRPGSLAARGLSHKALMKLNPDIVYASLSAWDAADATAPWVDKRGYDSMVQTVSGMNVSEAEHFGDTASPARITPVQALDHAAGYLLATGINAAVYRRAAEGGSWEVNVSLAGVMKYLRSLGQYLGRAGFECEPLVDVSHFLETRNTQFGELQAVRHSATVQGKEPGWDIMPKKLGSDEPTWINWQSKPP